MDITKDWKTIIKPYLKPEYENEAISYVTSLLKIAECDGAVNVLKELKDNFKGNNRI